jgi:hypothetical protein
MLEYKERTKKMNHQFDIDHAKEYGIEEAIIINNLVFWIQKNKANGKHQYNGKTWTYNSSRAFAELFPYMSEKKVQRILKSLIDQQVLATGNYNQLSFDRTLWYAFIDESKFLYCPKNCTELSNGKDESVQTIPDIKPSINPFIKLEEPAVVPTTSPTSQKPSKHKFGEYNNVLLTQDQYDNLIAMTDGKEAIDYFSAYRQEKGYKAKEDNLAIRRWVFDAVKEKKAKKKTVQPGLDDDYFKEASERIDREARELEEYKRKRGIR